jgi:acyl-coenzyme A thioesterase PaaI-like protein
MQVPCDPVIVYSHIGPVSDPTSELTAEGTLRLRADLRHGGGLFVAPLCIMVLDCAATNTTRLSRSAPTRIDVDVFEPAHDVTELRIRGSVTRNGRSQVFTEATIEDAGDPSRVIACAATSFAVSGPASVHKYSDHSALALPDDTVLPPLTEVFGGVPRPDGGYDIPALTEDLGHGRLHSGVMQVLGEAAALNAIRSEVGSADALRVEHLGTTVMTEGREGPFTVVPYVLTVDGATVGCRVEVRDAGAENRFVALVTATVRIGS